MSTDLIGESATRLFAQHAGAEGAGAHDDLWRAVSEAGFPLALLSEDEGGFGLAPEEAMTPLRIAAAHAAPIPLAETMLANWLLAQAGLPPVDGPAATAGGPARGVPRGVPWGRSLSHLVTAAPAEAGLHVSRLDVAGCDWRHGTSIAGEPRDDLAVPPAAALSGVAALDADVPQAMLALLRAQQLAGAVAAVLDMSVRYASERVQFGRTLAKFQAIQQYLAVMATEASAAGAAATMGALALPLAKTDPSRFRLLAGAAKLRAGEAAGVVAGLAHQVHGAIGFSHEYRLHPLTRRLWSWRDEAGAEGDWADTIGQSLFSRRTQQGLWPQIAALQSDFF